MLRFLRFLGVTLFCLYSLQGWALSGPETAQQLNQRLAATPVQCVGGKPPYACSGVLVRPMAEDHPQPFWHHAGEAREAGAERFYFMRRDRISATLPNPVGYILMDRFSAVGQGKPYEVSDPDSAATGEIMVRNWAEDAPGKLAVQALYYDMTEPASLLRAQRGQRDYFEATGTWLPLLRFGNQGVFGFNQQDQLYNGYQVAARLNARFADTAMTCRDGRAAYYCNGVILRTVGPGDFHAWNPSPNSIRIGGVSFSYYRRDLGSAMMVYPRGYVVRELSVPAVTPFEPLCFYPVDGATGNAPDGGICTLRSTCQALGVTTLADWLARYQAEPRSGCALTTSATDLQFTHDIRQQAFPMDAFTELVMRTWPQNIGKALPIEAVVYSLESLHGGDGLTDARHTQRDYLEQTGRYLPLLKTDFGSTDGQPFSFDPAEQIGP